jgi:thiamine kinase-like enzyme
MRQIIDALAPPLVLSHNDLLNGNIMRLADGTIQFIDFEYGGTNYRGFDLGGVELGTAPLLSRLVGLS